MDDETAEIELVRPPFPPSLYAMANDAVRVAPAEPEQDEGVVEEDD
jgi:hypothetical protein